MPALPNDKLGTEMATKPQPVPWAEVSALSNRLFAWLVRRKRAKSSDTNGRVAVCLKILTCAPAEYTLVERVALALYDVEMFRANYERDKRALAAARSGDPDQMLYVDHTIEEDTEQAIYAIRKKLSTCSGT